MVYLGIEPRAAGWKAPMNPLSYGGTPPSYITLAPTFTFSFSFSFFVRKMEWKLFLW